MDEKHLSACAEVFLKEQAKLFMEDVVFDFDEAKDFLEESFAFVCKDIKELRDALAEEGMDVSSMSDEELEEQLEVFKLPSGEYFVVEG